MSRTSILTDLQRAAIQRKLAADEPLDTMEQGQLLIMETEQALARGTKHYDKDGRLLPTVHAIIMALARDGSIEFETPEH